MKKVLTLSVLLLCLLTSNAQESGDVSTTTIKFEHYEFNYGQITQGEIVQNVFTFTNSGNEPLVITNVKGSCGCTVPEWTREPILPGELGSLLVKFNSKGKKGNQTKRVTITANTEPSNTYLTIKGIVEKEKVAQKIDWSKRNQVASADLISLYPNPTQDYINVKIKDYKGEKATLEIFNQQGKLVDREVYTNISGSKISRNIVGYTEGVYTATMIIGDKMRVAKQFVVTQ